MQKKDVVVDKKAKEKLKKEILNEINDDIKNELVNEVITEVKEQIDIEYKEDLKKIISDELIKDIKDTIRKDEARLSRRKSFKIFRMYIYVFLLLFLSGYLIYLLYINGEIDIDKYVEKKPTSQSTSITIPTTEVVKDLNWYKDKYSNLINDLKIDNPKFYIGKYYVSDIEINELLSIVYHNLDRNAISIDDKIYSIEETYIQSGFERLFGNFKTYSVSNFSVDGLDFVYSKNVGAYIAIKSGDFVEQKIVNDIYNIEEINDSIEISCYVGLVKDGSLYDVNNVNKELTSYHEGMDLSIKKYNLTKAKYTFIKIDNRYVLESITKI